MQLGLLKSAHNEVAYIHSDLGSSFPGYNSGEMKDGLQIGEPTRPMKQFKRQLRVHLDKNCDTELYRLEIYLPNDMVNDIKPFGWQYILDASLFKMFNVLIERKYCETPQQRARDTVEAVSVMDIRSEGDLRRIDGVYDVEFSPKAGITIHTEEISCYLCQDGKGRHHCSCIPL